MIRTCVGVLAAAATVASALAQSTPVAPTPAAPATTSPATAPASRPTEPSRPVLREAARPTPVPETLQHMKDVVYATAKDDSGNAVELTLDALYLKQSSGEPMPVIVYIHGGGFTGGSKEAGLQECIPFALGGYFAVTINYRLAPGSRFPAAVHDCKSAIRYLRKNASELVIDPTRIGVWGRSAGGYLAAMVAVSGNVPEMEGDVGVTGVPSTVAAFADYCGPVDLATMGEFDAKIKPAIDRSEGGPEVEFLGAQPKEHPDLAKKANVLTYVDKDDPPFFLVHGVDDNVVPVLQSSRLNAALHGAGVQGSFRQIPGARHNIGGPRVLLETARFFDENLMGAAADAIHAMMKQPGNPPPIAPAESQP